MADTGYNGWTNYSTWVVNLWLTNDEGSDTWLREQAEECLRDAIDNDESEPRDAAVSELASRLEAFHDENAPEVSGVFSDLLTHALGLVDWHEIAKNHVDDIDVYSAGWNMPGYMPDNEPALFIDDSDARLYISEEMDRLCDDLDEESADDIATGEALQAASLACLKGSGEYGATVAGYHYFVTKV